MYSDIIFLIVHYLIFRAAGFTAAGVAGGSFAAWWMSVAGPIASGSLFATLQSVGAAGFGAAGENTIFSFC